MKVNIDYVRKDLKKLQKVDSKEFEQVKYLIYALESKGSNLTRPQAAPIRDGIYELRPNKHRILYKILGPNEIILLLICKKSGSKVSTKDFSLATVRLDRYTK